MELYMLLYLQDDLLNGIVNRLNIDDYIDGTGNFQNMDWLQDTHWDEFLDLFYSNSLGRALPYEELVLGESSGTQTIGLDIEHLYAFEVIEAGPYDIRCNIYDGDADIYLFDSDLSALAYSMLYNPNDGSIERIRGYFAPGIYIVDVYGWMASSYSIVVN